MITLFFLDLVLCCSTQQTSLIQSSKAFSPKMAHINDYNQRRHHHHHIHGDTSDEGSMTIVYGGDGGGHQPWSLSPASSCNQNNVTKEEDPPSTLPPPLHSPTRKEKSISPSWILRRQDRRKRHRTWKQIQQQQIDRCFDNEEENRFSDDDQENLHPPIQDPFASLESLMEQLSQEQREQASSSNEHQQLIASPKRHKTNNKDHQESDHVHVQNAGGYIASSPLDFDVCVHNDHVYDETDEELCGRQYDNSNKSSGKRKKRVASSSKVSRNESTIGQCHQNFPAKKASKTSQQSRKGGKGSCQRSRSNNHAENAAIPPPSSTPVEKVKSIVGLR
jgi:hypothetical protein